jgi:hypothetical protein
VSETSSGPIRYQVVYSEFVRNELRKLIARAAERGIDAQVLTAAKEMDRRLRIYPQFGDLLADLSLAPGEHRIGTVPPLVVKYALYDDRRLVIVSTPIATLPRSGL